MVCPAEIRRANLKVVEERPAQGSAREPNSRRNCEIADWMGNIHRSIVVARPSSIGGFVAFTGRNYDSTAIIECVGSLLGAR